MQTKKELLGRRSKIFYVLLCVNYIFKSNFSKNNKIFSKRVLTFGSRESNILLALRNTEVFKA